MIDILLVIWACIKGKSWKPLWFWLRMLLLVFCIGFVLGALQMQNLLLVVVVIMEIYIWVRLIQMIVRSGKKPELGEAETASSETTTEKKEVE